VSFPVIAPEVCILGRWLVARFELQVLFSRGVRVLFTPEIERRLVALGRVLPLEFQEFRDRLAGILLLPRLKFIRRDGVPVLVRQRIGFVGLRVAQPRFIRRRPLCLIVANNGLCAIDSCW
jgi:hypothetical protein